MSNILTLLQADIKGIKMYRKGEMRPKKKKKRERGRGRDGKRQTVKEKEAEKEERNSNTTVKNCLDSCVRRLQYVKIN